MQQIIAGCVRIEFPATNEALWTYSTRNASYSIAPPVFEVDGQRVRVVPSALTVKGPTTPLDGVEEYLVEGTTADGLQLGMRLRTSPENPVVRFCYRLTSDTGARLTKIDGHDQLEYLRLQSLPQNEFREVRLSDFDDLVHSHRLQEEPIPAKSFHDGQSLMGPIICGHDGETAFLCAYEHGSSAPRRFVEYRLSPNGGIAMSAVQGNYYAGRSLDGDGYETIWLEFAAIPDTIDALAAAYREFVLRFMSPNAESRKPYIFYNTWNFQERNQAWNGKPYLDSIREKRMLDEIDVAHRMGIDVFVIDTGWYEKTGDWRVNKKFFPNGLAPLKERLDQYGMKLGLWYSPTQCAVSSSIARRMADCRMAFGGNMSEPYPVWETEESYRFCLVSKYWDAFADELIRCVQELGVTYFKWDAVDQWGCDAAGHFHGEAENNEVERSACYAFEQVRYMSRVIDKLGAACPEAIVDFDITENGRSVGLAFLASGKYFLINNGPYYQSFDDPQYAPGGGMGSNVFVFPGLARPRLCRHALSYDKWIPSVLFLTHFLPDDPARSQFVNIASMILGQNGIWGDLPSISTEGVTRYGELLELYKQVREDITHSLPVRSGQIGCNPEIHEKILADSGRGVVVIFSNCKHDSYRYVTTNQVDPRFVATEGVEVNLTLDGRAVIVGHFTEAGAAIVYFGVATPSCVASSPTV